jgi:very-short-patch-repair endonuclease
MSSTSITAREATRLRRAKRSTETLEALAKWLDERNGIAHSRDALAAGFTAHTIHTATERGAIARIRRTWLATPKATDSLRRAASIGGRLACLSAAIHHGLWTIDDGRLHLAVQQNASRFDPGNAVVHWSSGPIAPHRFELVEPVVDALAHLADCRPLDHALATWESAVRTGAVSLAYLERVPLRSRAARRVRDACGALSDSGIESIPVIRLARIGITVQQQVYLDGHHVDGVIGERLVYQMDGYSFHKSAEQRRADIAHDRRLTLMGYTVLRYDYVQIMFEWETVEMEIRAAIAAGAHLRRTR